MATSAAAAATIDFGIDLGTTNSSVALCRGGDVRMFQSTELMNVTPSVVYVSRTGRMLVGRKAYDTWVQDPQNTQAEFKRWMGYSDALSFPASGKQFTAEQLSAEVLKSLRADAERQTGERVTAAVITVPAAFGSLQCEATARAAALAGIEQAPLLQEPIAAAIAYGASPSARDQRWMVFDLGGGTLDIAIVSTRNNRLAVLEHRGNNRLGGKDIDRLIAERFLRPRLAQEFRLPGDDDDDERSEDAAQAAAAGRHRLSRALLRYAEQAKIALSTAAETTVEMFDVGEDLDGKPIEATMTLTRADLESAVAPVVEQCLELARQALAGARVSGSDLNQVLLVGGPTQMPVFRAALESTLGAKLGHGLDPMTVVAHGAALYASTLEKARPAGAAPAPASGGSILSRVAAALTPAGVVRIELAHERASGSAHSPVAGVIDPAGGIAEVKIDAAGGFWTSGWVPVVKGRFAVEAVLHESKPVTKFTLSARDATGAVKTDPAEFAIAYMLPMAAPPLPHTIAIELSTAHGVTTFDPVFRRNCPLPAEARKTYKADRTLRPSELEGTLPIKFWEIEVSDDPQEKWWAGCVHVRADRIKRPIVEGSELELTVQIDASRKLTVELFVPLLNQSFSNEVYVPAPPSARSQLQEQIDLCFERLDHVREEMYTADRDDMSERVEQLQSEAEEIAEIVGADASRNSLDPDAVLAPTDRLRRLRMQLTHLEEQLKINPAAPSVAQRLRWDVPHIERVVLRHGTESARREFERVREQYDRYNAAGDARGLKWVHDQVWHLYTTVVEDEMWHWEDQFAWCKEPERRYLNDDQARLVIAEGETAAARKDMPALRSVCRRLFKLHAPGQLQTAAERAAQSGLRGG